MVVVIVFVSVRLCAGMWWSIRASCDKRWRLRGLRWREMRKYVLRCDTHSTCCADLLLAASIFAELVRVHLVVRREKLVLLALEQNIWVDILLAHAARVRHGRVRCNSLGGCLCCVG